VSPATVSLSVRLHATLVPQLMCGLATSRHTESKYHYDKISELLPACNRGAAVHCSVGYITCTVSASPAGQAFGT
jgi:hypothetical protein